MPTITCKKCGEDGLTWISVFGKWQLAKADPTRLMMTNHKCQNVESKPAVCRDCGANDLHWFQNKMEDGTPRWMLTESFGLPHSCDERRKKLDDAKQQKRDFYAKEKERILADLKIPEAAKKRLLHNLRRDIWPSMFTKR
jgi:hypothetical protein